MNDPYIRIYDNTLPDDLCDQIIAAYEADSEGHQPGRTISGVDLQTSIRTVLMIGSRMETPAGAERWAALDKAIHNILVGSWSKYISDVPTGFYISGTAKIEDSGYHIQKYDKGRGYFRRHIDSSSFTVAFRVAAAIIYLNTVEVGGGTRFPDRDITVDCVKGRILWFPATWTYEHEGLMPVSDHKWSISTFLCHRGHKLLGRGGPAYNAITAAIGGFDG